MNPQAVSAVAELTGPNALMALAFDASLIALLSVVGVLLLGASLLLVAREEAVVTLRRCAIAVLSLAALYFAVNASPASVLALRPFLVMTLCGVLLFARLFELGLGRAAVCSLSYCFLVVVAAGYTHRYVDGQIPNRLTVDRSLAAAVDQFARDVSNDQTLPASAGVVPALMRAAWLPSPRGRPAARPIPPTAVSTGIAQPTGTAETATAPAVTNPAVACSAAGVAVPQPVAACAPPVPTATAVAWRPADGEVPAAPAASMSYGSSEQVSRARGTTSVVLCGLEGISRERRRRWQDAQREIRVVGVCTSSKASYALVGDRMVLPGGTHTVVHLGVEYVFRFRGVNALGLCRWEPVLQADRSTETVVTF